MIKSMTITGNSYKEIIALSRVDASFVIDCSKILSQQIGSFSVEIEFNYEIIAFRNHDYTWVAIDSDRIANTFATKALKLNFGMYVQANLNEGIWEVKKSNNKKLFWHFNPDYACSLTNYSGKNNSKTISNASTITNFEIQPTLLFSLKGIVEISRSKLPFSAIACFTDHCDFDTLPLLQKQRDLFDKTAIKTTKGFFLNHFSKRSDNSSWQNESDELQKWIDKKHELAYHSLSQSIKSKEDSLLDFDTFKPPFPILTWIDHGYQPYNFSLYKKETIDETYFAAKLNEKKIQLLWNYIDSGTATTGVINQLNPKQFTLHSFWKGIQNKPLKKRLSLFIKNTIVHFYNDEVLIKNYTKLASSFKKLTNTKSVIDLLKFIKKFGLVFFPLLKIVLFWYWNKNKIYPLAQYTPVFFEHKIGSTKFIIFQTLELLDFKNAFTLKSINSLINDSGLFIGHTYFSVPLDYHDGRIFDKSGTVNKEVEQNFNYLSDKIKDKSIWNPTLIELATYWKMYTNLVFELNENKEIVFLNSNQLSYRIIT